MSLKEIVEEFVEVARAIPGCRAVLIDSAKGHTSYGWPGLDFYVLAGGWTLDDERSFQGFVGGVHKLHARMMKRWYPTYWHPFNWMVEDCLDYLGPLERGRMERASLVYGHRPKIHPRLEAPVMYYASRLRNDFCQIRRWLYAYGPEGMVGGNWGKFVGWTERICRTGLAIIDPHGLQHGKPLTHLDDVVGGEEAQTAQQVLDIREDDISTRKGREAFFPALIRSVSLQRAVAAQTAGKLGMDHWGQFETPRQTIPKGDRAGYRPHLAGVEVRLLEGMKEISGTDLVCAYLCRGEPSSLAILARDSDTGQAVRRIREIYPSQHDIFTWLVFEEELPLFTHESPAEFVPGSFGLIQPRQLLWGDDLISRTTVPTGPSALSCLNSFLPMVRAYGFYTKSAQGDCEPEGLDPWIDSCYSRAKLLMDLCRLGDPSGESLETITSQRPMKTRPRTVEEGLFELETTTARLNTQLTA